MGAQAPPRPCCPPPPFAEYAAALESVGCEVKRKTLHEADDFAVTEAFVQAVNQSIDLVFLCQPNNPTGQITPPELVQRLVRRCADCGAVLVVDECFLDFLQQRDALTAKPLFASRAQPCYFESVHQTVRHGRGAAGVCLVRQHGAAGQNAGRGSAVGGYPAWRRLRALPLCGETAYADAVRALIADQRPRLAAGLRALGLQVIEGQRQLPVVPCAGNAGCGAAAAGRLPAQLRQLPGLSAGWYRTAVRTAPENEQLLQTMREVLK